MTREYSSLSIKLKGHTHSTVVMSLVFAVFSGVSVSLHITRDCAVDDERL